MSAMQTESWDELILALERAKMYAEAACDDLAGEWPDSKLVEALRAYAGEAANGLGNALYAARKERQRLAEEARKAGGGRVGEDNGPEYRREARL